MERLSFRKASLIVVAVLVSVFFSYEFISAQQEDKKPDPLIVMRTKAVQAIKEMEGRKDLSPGELQILQELKKNKEAIEKKINDLKIDLGEGVSPSAKSFEEMQAKIKEKELSLKATEDEAMQKRIKEKELSLKATEDEAMQKRIKEKELSLEIAGKELRLKERIVKEKAQIKQAEDELNAQCLTCNAVAVGKIELCKEIQDKKQFAECHQFSMILRFFDELNRNKQITNNSLDICEEFLGDDKSVENPDKCKLICDAYLKRDFTTVANYFKGEGGLISLALLSGDSKYCSYASDQKNTQGDCLNNAYFSSAVRSNNKELCAKINNPQLRTICQVYFDRDEGECVNFKNTELAKRRENIEKQK